MARSKRVCLGFVVVETSTGEQRSIVFTRRAPAVEISTRLSRAGERVGVRKLEEHVPVEWKRGRDFEILAGALVVGIPPVSWIA